jgi:hypothetical protein
MTRINGPLKRRATCHGDLMKSEPRSPIREAFRSIEDEHRVVRFRPRRARPDGLARWREPMHHRDPGNLLVEGIARYERDGQDDDYRHRMIVNGLGLVAAIVLIVVGTWLAVIVTGD